MVIIKVLEGVHSHFIHLHQNEDVIELLDNNNANDVLKKKILSYVHKSSNTNNDQVNILTFKKFLRCFKCIMNKKVNDIQQKKQLRR